MNGNETFVLKSPGWLKPIGFALGVGIISVFARNAGAFIDTMAHDPMMCIVLLLALTICILPFSVPELMVTSDHILVNGRLRIPFENIQSVTVTKGKGGGQVIIEAIGAKRLFLWGSPYRESELSHFLSVLREKVPAACPADFDRYQWLVDAKPWTQAQRPLALDAMMALSLYAGGGLLLFLWVTGSFPVIGKAIGLLAQLAACRMGLWH